MVSADSVKTDESSARVVNALLREDGDVVAAGDEEGTASAMEVIPHGVPGIGLVEGTVIRAAAAVVGVAEEVAVILKAEDITLAVGIGDGQGSDVSALEVEVGPDGCLAVTKVKGIETDVGKEVDMDISLGAGARGAAAVAMVVAARAALLLVLGRGDGSEAEESGNERRPDLHSALWLCLRWPRIGHPGLL